MPTANPLTVAQAREAVLRDACPECGHSVGWHGENHDDGCNYHDHDGGCVCGLNARDCHDKINKTADVDALIAAVRAECRAEGRDDTLRKAVTKVRDNTGMAVVKLTLLSGTKGASASDKKVIRAVSAALDVVVKEINAALTRHHTEEDHA